MTSVENDDTFVVAIQDEYGHTRYVSDVLYRPIYTEIIIPDVYTEAVDLTISLY